MFATVPSSGATISFSIFIGSHGSPANISGKYYNVVSYDVNHDTGLIDYDQIRDMAKKCQPKLIIAGASAYPRAIDFKLFADIAHEVGAVFMVDMAHIAGLVAGGAHMSPVPYADIVTTTTHKTLRGPRGGLILAREEFAKKLNSGVFPGTQGGPLEHVIAAKAVCLKEAMSDDTIGPWWTPLCPMSPYMIAMHASSFSWKILPNTPILSLCA